MAGRQVIKISESDLRNIIHCHIMEAISTPSLSLIAKKNRLTELSDANLLEEGIFKSYDVSFVVRYLSEKLNFTTDQQAFSTYQAEGFIFTEEDYNGECDNVNVVVPISYKRMNELQKIMSACGYMEASRRELNDGLFLQLDYEKNFQKEIRGLVSKYKYIYHLTPSVYVDKILKQGLVPRNNNEFLKYAPRIYFLLDKRTIDYKAVADMLYNKMLEYSDDKDAVEKYKNTYTLLRIKTSNIIGKIKFYIDNNFPNSVYTTENIAPEYIEVDTKNIEVINE